MLAQGQSSSTKRGGLVADVSSGLTFLKKKKKILEWQGEGRVASLNKARKNLEDKFISDLLLQTHDHFHHQRFHLHLEFSPHLAFMELSTETINLNGANMIKTL